MQIYDITSRAFEEYGRVVKNVDFSSFIEELSNIQIPDLVIYEPSVASLEDKIKKEDADKLFGGISFQAGYCTGHNTRLNAVEYHRSSEFNVAATDAILLLGRQRDISAAFTYETARMEAFFVPAGVAVELYATTLHYAPCSMQKNGFMVGVLLPKGTNLPLSSPRADDGEARLLAAANKWMIGHKEADLPEGTYLGLNGKNLDIRED